MKKISLLIFLLFIISPVLWAADKHYTPQYNQSAATNYDSSEPATKAFNEHTGYYIEANAGTNFAYLLFISSGSNEQLNSACGFAMGVAFGKMLKPTFGLEGGFLYSHIAVDENDEVEALYIPYFTTRFTKPLGERFSIYAKVGLMAPVWTENETSGDDESYMIILPFTGIGANYAITENLDFTLQYQGAFYLIAGIGQATGGFQYKF